MAGSTFDLHADEAGVAWDITRPQDRKRAWERIRAEEPFLVVGSPPCTMFSRLQLNLNANKMGKVEWDRRRREAEVLLIFAVAVYALQARAGRRFLHEHPAGATSWRHPAVVKLRARPGVDAVVAHMCEFGMETSAEDGGRASAKKPTRFMSSSPAVQARAEEIKFMLDWGVWERALVTDCWRETGRAPIGSKWVDVNKGDAA